MKHILKMFSPKEESETIENMSGEELDTARRDQRKNRLEEMLAEYRKLDDAEREFFRMNPTKVLIEKAGNRTFVRLGDQEFVAQYCTHIAVSSLGEPPRTAHIYAGSWAVHAATPATITAHMASGREVVFTVSRHCVDEILASLQVAHQEAVK